MLLKKFGRDGPVRLDPMMGWVMRDEPERIVWRLRGRSETAIKWGGTELLCCSSKALMVGLRMTAMHYESFETVP